MPTQTKIIDFIPRKEIMGFRLMRLEMYNWGTFHNAVWEICPDGHNSLLTGDIGSGKSTIVDAVTTLIVPHHRIIFNRAAGAESKERSLYSYIRGEYKNVKYENSGSGKPVALRSDNSYTVLLGYFYNSGFRQGITLAQVFWIKDQGTNPERFFVIAEKDLSIPEHFSNFGKNILDLKKKLKKTEQVKLFINFKTYSNRFRQLFGIKNPQALDLFYQTVSMKSVGNLTAFIRQHMLDQSDVGTRIQDIRNNFENLNQAHLAVLKAKSQIESLSPFIAEGQVYHQLQEKDGEFRNARETLGSYFASARMNLLKARIIELKQEIEKASQKIIIAEKDIHHLRDQESSLKTSIDDNGGRRLSDIEREITHLEKEREQKQQKETYYHQLAGKLPLETVRTSDDFFENRKKAGKLLKGIQKNIELLRNDQVDLQVNIRETKKDFDRYSEELSSLKKRKSNIPLKNLMIRREMAETLSVDENEMPFAGELITVDEKEKKWEGAVERLLRNFGLSLLVPDHLYQQVSRYVEKTHLKGRLVYFRVQGARITDRDYPETTDSLSAKVIIKPDSPFHDWLFREVNQRFDYTCCEDMETFRRLPRAITVSGQIKTGGKRHEKDDRHAINDKTRYILGWQNREKIDALKKIVKDIEKKGQALSGTLNDLMKKLRYMESRKENCRDLLSVSTYDEIRWQDIALKIQGLSEEKDHIENGSDILKQLKEHLSKTLLEISRKEDEIKRHYEKKFKSEQMFEDRKKELDTAREVFTNIPEEKRTTFFPTIDAFRTDVLKETKVNLNNIDKCHSEVRHHLQQQIDAIQKRIKQLTEKIIKQMQAYKNIYPSETAEVDAGMEALPEYEEMLGQLKKEDLPRHEDTFKRLLNEGTINSIALFQNQLEKEKQEIEKKIATINQSVNPIEYNPGTYIELLTDPAPDRDIRDFQADLKACLSHTLDGNDIYNEEKFLQVKKLLDRFNGREGYAELDRKWTDKVTDVRNWFIFSAVEKWREDNKEREYYSDSSGKSGGQKEKLAYTILAAALAYQFGLQKGKRQSRSFRFVVIDEAFGRGSDESTRYGLELFNTLNLQLLIVTPLQKINIIEDYIKSVHFVHNESGKKSLVKNLTVEEYREEKKNHQEGVAH